jgi:hypothetical protein
MLSFPDCRPHLSDSTVIDAAYEWKLQMRMGRESANLI